MTSFKIVMIGETCARIPKRNSTWEEALQNGTSSSWSPHLSTVKFWTGGIKICHLSEHIYMRYLIHFCEIRKKILCDAIFLIIYRRLLKNNTVNCGLTFNKKRFYRIVSAIIFISNVALEIEHAFKPEIFHISTFYQINILL